MKNDKNLKDVTEEVFGTKNNIPDLPDGFEPMNLPAKFDSKESEPVIPAEITDRQKELDKCFKDVTKNFVRIGFHLLHFKESKEYKVLGYKQFDAFVKSEYSLSKSTAYNFINVCAKYSAKDADGKPTSVLGKEYQKYTSSQLVAMLKMNEEAIAQIDPKKTIAEINKVVKTEKNYSDEFDPDSDENEENDNMSNTQDNNRKKNDRDKTIPMMRLSMARGQTWDEVTTDKIRKACELYLADDKRQVDGNDYTIEICITYPDKSAL